MSDTGFKTAGTEEVDNWTIFTLTLLNTSDDADCRAWGTTYLDAEVSDFTFGIPGGATIDGIEAQAEFAVSGGSSRVASLRLSLSWNDGTSWTSTKVDTVTGPVDQTKTFGGASDTWGRSWTDSEFADGTFRVKIEGKADGIFRGCDLDFFQIKVHYTEAVGDIDEIGDTSWASNIAEIGDITKANTDEVGDISA